MKLTEIILHCIVCFLGCVITHLVGGNPIFYAAGYVLGFIVLCIYRLSHINKE